MLTNAISRSRLSSYLLLTILFHYIHYSCVCPSSRLLFFILFSGNMFIQNYFNVKEKSNLLYLYKHFNNMVTPITKLHKELVITNISYSKLLFIFLSAVIRWAVNRKKLQCNPIVRYHRSIEWSQSHSNKSSCSEMITRQRKLYFFNIYISAQL